MTLGFMKLSMKHNPSKLTKFTGQKLLNKEFFGKYLKVGCAVSK